MRREEIALKDRLFYLTIAAMSGFAALIGCWLLLSLLSSVWYGWRSNHWPTAEGVITYGSIDVIGTTRIGSKGRIAHNVTGARVEYMYQVEGKYYRGRRITYNKGLLTDPHRALHGRSTGRKVDVYYDPWNPNRCVLVPGASGGFVFFGLLAFCLALIGSCGLIAWGILRMPARRSAKPA